MTQHINPGTDTTINPVVIDDSKRGDMQKPTHRCSHGINICECCKDKTCRAGEDPESSNRIVLHPERQRGVEMAGNAAQIGVREMSIIDHIPIPVRIGLCLLVLLGIVFVLDNIQYDLARSQYPLTYEYSEVNITERMTTSSNCGYIISDDGTRYHICGSLFWNTIPNHRYKVEQAYNYSTHEATLTFGKTDPFITSVERIP